VSTFYLLPPRAQVGARFAAYLQTCFPGLDWPAPGWAGLADLLAAAAADRPDVYVVYREELPEGEDAGDALASAFGAEPGDEVVEVLPTGKRGAADVRRWHLARPTTDAPVVRAGRCAAAELSVPLSPAEGPA
jgi:hypothetical protein